jgi:DNA-binding transcriptional MerR regulator
VAVAWSIGEVLRRLRPDFPDVSISKIRFLESEGLITPERTASGYRRFTEDDLRRLRYVLAAQRDQYLPLRVIKEHLAAIDRGLQPPDLPGAPRVPLAAVADAGPDAAAFDAGSDLRMSESELLEESGLAADALAALKGYGLLAPIPGSEHYDADALLVAQAVAGFAQFGLEPRHLRSFKAAADRELGLIEQVVTPMTRLRANSAARASEAARELAALSVRLHIALLRAGLPDPIR